ncbi:MAG TPA: ribonuclease P [Candidatus Thermoplasmatota archaeon]|nr:ribonuclease P [Candidatus Thermoplasmatota archaeon]
MSRKHNGKKKVYKNIARHRICYLFSLAETCGSERKFHLSDRYVALARKISMKYLVPIPAEYTRRFCKHCYSYHVPSLTCRVRIHRGIIITYCSKCNKYNRMPLHQRSSPSHQS